MAEDVKRHVIDLKNTVYKVRGQVTGQTLLPMPDGVSRVHEVEQRIIESLSFLLKQIITKFQF